MGTEIQPFWTSWRGGGAGCNLAFAKLILASRGISGGVSPSLQAANIQYSWRHFFSFKRSNKYELSLTTTLAQLGFYKWQKLKAERKVADHVADQGRG